MNHATTFALGLMTDVLAQDGPRQTGPDFGKASPFGLIIVVLLLIAVFGLVWSMNKHLRKLPKSFDESPDGPESVDGTEGPGGPDGTDTTVGTDPDLSTDNPADGKKRESG